MYPTNIVSALSVHVSATDTTNIAVSSMDVVVQHQQHQQHQQQRQQQQQQQQRIHNPNEDNNIMNSSNNNNNQDSTSSSSSSSNNNNHYEQTQEEQGQQQQQQDDNTNNDTITMTTQTSTIPTRHSLSSNIVLVFVSIIATIIHYLCYCCYCCFTCCVSSTCFCSCCCFSTNNNITANNNSVYNKIRHLPICKCIYHTIIVLFLYIITIIRIIILSYIIGSISYIFWWILQTQQTQQQKEQTYFLQFLINQFYIYCISFFKTTISNWTVLSSINVMNASSKEGTSIHQPSVLVSLQDQEQHSVLFDSSIYNVTTTTAIYTTSTCTISSSYWFMLVISGLVIGTINFLEILYKKHRQKIHNNNRSLSKLSTSSLSAIHRPTILENLQRCCYNVTYPNITSVFWNGCIPIVVSIIAIFICQIPIGPELLVTTFATYLPTILTGFGKCCNIHHHHCCKSSSSSSTIIIGNNQNQYHQNEQSINKKKHLSQKKYFEIIILHSSYASAIASLLYLFYYTILIELVVNTYDDSNHNNHNSSNHTMMMTTMEYVAKGDINVVSAIPLCYVISTIVLLTNMFLFELVVVARPTSISIDTHFTNIQYRNDTIRQQQRRRRQQQQQQQQRRNRRRIQHQQQRRYSWNNDTVDDNIISYPTNLNIDRLSILSTATSSPSPSSIREIDITSDEINTPLLLPRSDSNDQFNTTNSQQQQQQQHQEETPFIEVSSSPRYNGGIISNADTTNSSLPSSNRSTQIRSIIEVMIFQTLASVVTVNAIYVKLANHNVQNYSSRTHIDMMSHVVDAIQRKINVSSMIHTTFNSSITSMNKNESDESQNSFLPLYAVAIVLGLLCSFVVQCILRTTNLLQRIRRRIQVALVRRSQRQQQLQQQQQVEESNEGGESEQQLQSTTTTATKSNNIGLMTLLSIIVFPMIACIVNGLLTVYIEPATSGIGIPLIVRSINDIFIISANSTLYQYPESNWLPITSVAESLLLSSSSSSLDGWNFWIVVTTTRISSFIISKGLCGIVGGTLVPMLVIGGCIGSSILIHTHNRNISMMANDFSIEQQSFVVTSCIASCWMSVVSTPFTATVLCTLLGCITVLLLSLRSDNPILLNHDQALHDSSSIADRSVVNAVQFAVVCIGPMLVTCLTSGLVSWIGRGGFTKSFDFRRPNSTRTSTNIYNNDISQEQQQQQQQQQRLPNGHTNYVINYSSEYNRRQEHSFLAHDYPNSTIAAGGLGLTNDIENDTNISTGFFDFPSMANTNNNEDEYDEDHDHDDDGYDNHHDHHSDTGEDDDDDIDFDFSSDVSFHNANSSYRSDDEILRDVRSTIFGGT